MQKLTLTLTLTLALATCAFAQKNTKTPYFRHLTVADPECPWEQMKVIDDGGIGNFTAVALKEKSLPGYVVYRPLNIRQAVQKEGKLPVLVFANGGCMDTSIGYERMLTNVASHGYVVVAIGEMQVFRFDRKENSTPSSMLADAMDWIVAQSQNPESDYYQMVDIEKIAAAGHSCGGAQVLYNAKDTRLKTYLILNAGMGPMEMAGASKKNLKQLHAPIIYMTGGEGDVAYHNAEMDFKSIKKVQAVWADNPKAGHGGTYEQPNGGSFATMVIDWLDLQLKNKNQKAANFQCSDETVYPGWTILCNKRK